MSLIAANVRDPVTAEGDLLFAHCLQRSGARSCRTCSMTSARRPGGSGEISCDLEQAHAREIERRDGEFRNRCASTVIEEPVDLVCHPDGQGSASESTSTAVRPTQHAGINVPLPYTEAYAHLVCAAWSVTSAEQRGLAAGDSGHRAEGSILNATAPAAVSARHCIGQMLPDVVLGCLAQLLPERCRRRAHRASGTRCS